MMLELFSASKGIALGGQIALILVGIVALAATVFVLLRVSANFKNHYTVEFVEQKAQKVYVCGGKIDLTEEQIDGVFSKFQAQINKGDDVANKNKFARECVGIYSDYNADRSTANFYVGRVGQFEKAQEHEIPAGTYAKLTVAKRSRVKEALRALSCFESQRDYRCDYRQFREDGSVEIYVSLFMPKTAAELVAIAGEEKSVADWVEIEREKLEDVLDQDKDPMTYIDTELAKKQSPIQRKLALKSVKQDLLKLTADLEEELKAKPIVENKAYVIPKSSDDAVAARAAFVSAKNVGQEPPAFALSCRITKEDAIDYLNQHMVGDKYPLKTFCKRSKNGLTPDALKCGDWAFALLTEQRKVLKLVLRLSKSDAEIVEKLHSGFAKSNFLKGSEWYDAIIDTSYLTKQEVFDLLERAYKYTLTHTYAFDNVSKRYTTNTENALAEANLIDNSNQKNLLNSAFEKAVTEQKQAYALYLNHYKNNPYTVSRARLLDSFEKSKLEELTCVRRVPYRPFSLKYKNKTFAMVYENMGAVKLVVKAEESYIRQLEKQHPITFKARFPKGKNWYVVMLDASYATQFACLAVLLNSYNFLANKPDSGNKPD